MKAYLTPPSVPVPPLAPILEAKFPIPETPMLNFLEMMQNVALAHEQEVGHLQEEIKRLQTLLYQNTQINGIQDRDHSCGGALLSVIDAAKEDLPSKRGDLGELGEVSYARAPEELHPDRNGAGNVDKPTGSMFQSNRTMDLTGSLGREIHKKAKKTNLQKVLEGRRIPASIAFLDGPFDACVGFLVVINAALMFIEYEYEGFSAAVSLGIRFEDGRWDNAQDVFQIASHIFNLSFLLELILRVGISGRHFFFDDFKGTIHWIAIFDAVVVLTTSIDMYVVQPLLGPKTDVNASAFRLMRLARVTRALRVVRVMHLFTKLRVLVDSLNVGMMSLFWSMVLMAVLMFIGALVICRIVNPFMVDDSIPMETRLWMYEFYGTSSLAAYTMFEVTFAGCWPNYARPLVTEVSAWFALFWFFYIVIVVFAVTRIITALFLKDTMQEMQNDIENTIASRVLQRDAYIKKLRELFHVADKSGDGVLTLEELTDVLQNQTVLHMFASLELEIHEVWALYNLLEDDGDGGVTYNEFLRGIVRLKGQARALDVVALGRDCENILNKTVQIEKRIDCIIDTLEDNNSSPRLPKNPVQWDSFGGNDEGAISYEK